MDVFESGGKLITNGAKAILLLVTGIMTWQFLFYVMGPDKWLFAALGLVAFEVGLYAWPYLYQNDAVTTAQELVAAIMTVVCWVGIAIAFIGEVMRYNTGAAALLAQIQPVMPYFIMAIVVLNVGAYIMFPAMSPEAANKRANKRAAFAQQKADTLRTVAQADRIIAQAQQDVRGMKTGGAHGAPPAPGLVWSDDENRWMIPNPYTTDPIDPNGKEGAKGNGPLPGSGTQTRRAKSTQNSQPPR